MTAPFEYGRKDWERNADAAYAEATRRIEWARANPAEPWLFLSDLYALERLPPDLAACQHLERFSLGTAVAPDGTRYAPSGGSRYRVKDWRPLAQLTGLTRLDLARCQLADLDALDGLSDLRTLDIGGTDVRDLGPLSAARGLQVLNINGLKVSDLTPLQSALEIQELYAVSTWVTDLTPLSGATSLQSLDLWGTKVTDLAPLSGATSLKSLDLEGTGVTDLSPLSGAAELRELILDNTKVHDLEQVFIHRNLQVLQLRGYPIRDVTPLAALTSLRRLNLFETAVDDLAPLLANPAFTGDDPMELCVGKTPLVKMGAWRELDDLYWTQAHTKRAVELLLEEGHEIPPAPPAPAPEPPTERYVFISYASADAAKVDRICDAVEGAGLRIWRDRRDGLIGADVNRMIEQAVDGAAAVLTLWSPAAVQSDYVRGEAERARGQGKLIPALIAPTAPPLVFSGINTADLTHWAGDAADPEFQRVLQALRMLHEAGLSRVQVMEREDGLVGLAQRPVRRRPVEDDAEARLSALRDQKRLAEMIVEDAKFEIAEMGSNSLHRLHYYVGRYDAQLAKAYEMAEAGEDQIWQGIDQRFYQVRPLAKDESLSDGFRTALAELEKAHDGLRAKINPDQSGMRPEEEDEVDPVEAGAAAKLLRKICAYLSPDRFLPEVGDFIDEQAQIIEDEAGLDSPGGAEAAQTPSSRVGRAVRTALGVVGTLGALAGLHSWQLTGGPGEAMAAILRAFEALVKLLL